MHTHGPTHTCTCTCTLVNIAIAPQNNETRTVYCIFTVADSCFLAHVDKVFLLSSLSMYCFLEPFF